ncbi:hypothetical protein H0O02_02410 [Candidatus Micrarchaeota archaeon]|nr:hypothetical protein [Candidatus Micrarchaeota archaeon]
MKVTLTHIGAFALGRLLAVWSFVLGIIMLIVGSMLLLLLMILGMATSENPVDAFGGGVIGFIIFFVVAVIALVVNSIAAFIFGMIAATVYNIILGIGGGIDLDFRDRGG